MAKLVKKISTQTPALVEKAVQFGKPKLVKFWSYAKVEFAPPTPGEIPEILRGFKDLIVAARTRRFMDFTVKQAAVNTLIGAECVCWFFVGEVVGKRHWLGYYIPR